MIDFMVNIFVFPNEKQMLSIVLLSLIYTYNISLEAKNPLVITKLLTISKQKNQQQRRCL